MEHEAPSVTAENKLGFSEEAAACSTAKPSMTLGDCAEWSSVLERGA